MWHVVSAQGGGADGQAYTVMQAGFGPNLAPLVAATASAPLSLIRADPADGCTPFNRPTVFAGKAVIMQRGNCSFQAKVSLVALICPSFAVRNRGSCENFSISFRGHIECSTIWSLASTHVPVH